MSESQKANPTRCPTVYCLNSDSVFYDVELTVQDTENGVWITGDTRIPHGARVAIVSTATVSRTVRVVGTNYTATVAPNSNVFLALTDGEVDPWQPDVGSYELQLIDEPNAATYRVTIYHPGALDMNQSSVALAINGGGCCRTSVAITATHYFSGFLGNNGAYGRRYMTKTVTTEYYPFTSGGFSVQFAGVNDFSPYAFPGVRRRVRQRFRSKKWLIRARDEYVIEQNSGGVYTPDNSGYITFFEQPGARFEAHFPEGGDQGDGATDSRAFFIEAGQIKIVSDQLATIQLKWFYGGLDNEGIIQPPFVESGLAGVVTIQLEDEYTIEEALGYLDAAMDTGLRWANVEYPYTRADVSFYSVQDAAVVTVNGCRLDNGTENQTEIVDASGPTYTSDAEFGGTADVVWPPETGAAWCDEQLSCGGNINSPVPPQYRCIYSDDGNSLNGLLPANANSLPDPDAGIALTAEMFALDHPSNPLRNPCATKQNRLSNDPEDADPEAKSVISPPLHHMAEITFTALEWGIELKRTAVKHWWGAPFCRRVYEVKEKEETTTELLDCESELEGLRHDSQAPCAWVDDPARQLTRIPAGDETALTGYDAAVVGWASEIQPGQVFTRVVEMTCPDLEQPASPCGCE